MPVRTRIDPRPGLPTIIIYGDWLLVAVAVILDDLLNHDKKWRIL
jgi:hypothetical protein